MPGQNAVPDAAEALKSAVDQHLAACAARSGESDPRVQSAYDAVRAAAEAYDDALYEAYGEVTPFEFSSGPAVALAEGEAPARFGLLLRRDYVVADVEELTEAAQRAAADDWPEAAGPAPTDEVDSVGRAVYQLLNAYGIDGFDEVAEDSGLEPAGGTVWIVAEAEDDESLYDEPFVDVDEERLLARLDEVFEG